tara:strand:- start:5379 stop:6119 length:741 start_codon:yes stop_codon:yes gene_type:complete
MATHFKGPVLFSNATAFENLKVSMWPDQFTYMDDFNQGALDATHNWTIVKDSGAAAAIAADGLNGEVNLTSTATTDNDGASIQAKQESFALPTTAGNKLYFETRVKISDATQTDFLVGFTETFATNPENALLSSNVIGFVKVDGTAIVKGTTESGDTQTLVEFADTTKSTMENDTYVTLGLVATKNDSTNKVQFFINRNLVGSSTTNIPTANMKVMAMSVSGDTTGTKVTTIDYIMAAQDRDVSYS